MENRGPSTSSPGRIRVSSGTASVLGLSHGRIGVPPTTAYLMAGEGCRNACDFCAQGRSRAASEGYLSRVKWPLFPEEEVIEASARAFAEGLICKVCIQVVSSNGVFERMISFIERLRRRCPVPISLSAADADVKTMEALVSAGVERLAIPLDAASPALFSLIKKADWDERIQSLHTASRLFSRGAATHLIAGLGEEEREMTELMSALYADRITVGLFAFTPLRGTAMENRMPPSLCSYRRVQAAHHLIRNGIVWPIAYDSGRIVFEGDREALRAILSDGRAFRTTGCDNCNRPYYNERAGGVMYNYPRPLTEDECRTALCEALDS